MWLARDKNGALRIWTIKPYKGENAGEWTLGIVNQCSAYINETMYREVKWTDKEPRELILKPLKDFSGKGLWNRFADLARHTIKYDFSVEPYDTIYRLIAAEPVATFKIVFHVPRSYCLKALVLFRWFVRKFKLLER